MSELSHVTIYTDGSALGNPGPGGYGVVMSAGDFRKELSGGFRHTTNNRMEILAVIKALEALNRHCQVTLYSDSRYVVDAISKGWARKWRAKGWMRNKTESALNPDLWERAAGARRTARCRLPLGARAHRRPGQRAGRPPGRVGCAGSGPPSGRGLRGLRRRPR